MITDWKFFGDSVVVKPDVTAETKVGGIIIRAESQKKENTGTVMAIGPGTWEPDGSFRELGTKVGDRIMYNKFSAVEITVDGDSLIMIEENDILGYLETEDELGLQLKVSLM